MKKTLTLIAFLIVWASGCKKEVVQTLPPGATFVVYNYAGSYNYQVVKLVEASDYSMAFLGVGKLESLVVFGFVYKDKTDGSAFLFKINPGGDTSFAIKMVNGQTTDEGLRFYVRNDSLLMNEIQFNRTSGAYLVIDEKFIRKNTFKKEDNESVFAASDDISDLEKSVDKFVDDFGSTPPGKWIRDAADDLEKLADLPKKTGDAFNNYKNEIQNKDIPNKDEQQKFQEYKFYSEEQKKLFFQAECQQAWGAGASVDMCGYCVGGSSGRTACKCLPSERKCDGQCPGETDAYIDNCGICVKGNTGKTPCGECPPEGLTVKINIVYLSTTIIADATVTGGSLSGDYTYQWSSGTDPNKEVVSNLEPGGLSVTVSDPNGCSGVGTATVKALEVSISKSGISLTASASGGTEPYEFKWSNSQTGPTINNLVPGTYTVTANDKDGIKGTASATMDCSTSTLSVTTTKTSNSATAIPSGGVLPYEYEWSNNPGNWSTNPTANGLSPNTYKVTVKDKGDCTASASVTIDNIGPPNVVFGTPVYMGSKNVYDLGLLSGKRFRWDIPIISANSLDPNYIETYWELAIFFDDTGPTYGTYGTNCDVNLWSGTDEPTGSSFYLFWCNPTASTMSVWVTNNYHGTTPDNDPISLTFVLTGCYLDQYNTLTENYYNSQLAGCSLWSNKLKVTTP